MKKILVPLMLLLATVTTETLADLEVDQNNVAKCNQKDADAGMTYAIIACSSQETNKSDLELNRVYSHLIVDIQKENDSKLAKKYIQHLKMTQRAWIKYRDTQCIYDQDGGRLESLRLHSCIDNMTAKRTQELKDTRCAEGDLTSPCYLYK
ncbi:MAG: DUF1311 domain-containing protein [Methylotenera sp.]|nr:DUF1311 domain-containing protein [Methylotenera sp.]MDD4925412.1 DUF1311 domain-containing protein [Methylotenera sp.]